MTPLPVDELRRNVEKLGRQFTADVELVGRSWRGDEFGLEIRWPDGFTAWVGLGPEASAIIEARFYATKH
jgi:hypothetical protein